MKLYHYTTYSGALGILAAKSMWASCIHYLNDKDEFRHGIDLALEIARFLVHCKGPNAKRLLEMIIGQLPTLQQRFLCVVSFAEDGDLLSQWRGYAVPGGVSLGFRKDALEAAGNPEQFQLRKCIYDNAQKRDIITAYFKDFLQNISESRDYTDADIWNLAANFVSTFQVHASCFKHQSFAEENEWRLASPIIAEYGARIAVRPGPNLPIPYYNLPLQQVDDRGLTDVGLESIMIGPHRDQELAERALEIAAATSNIRLPRVTRSSIPYRSV